MIIFKKNTLALAVASSLMAVTAAMAAEEPGAEKALELKEVVVTGEKIERSQDKTLSSVAVVTSEDIRAHGDQDLQNVLDRTPGIYAQSGNENWGIRGIPVSGFDDQGPAAMNGAVSVYVDDALQVNRLLTHNPMLLWDMEQVEVYRGAQSTTQGRNSLAGAIIMKSKDPTFDPEFSVRSNAGKYGERGTSAMANGTLIDGLVAGRLAVDYQTSDGYIENEFLDMDANQLRSSNIRGKFLILPSDDMDVLLTFARTKQRSGVNAVAANNGRPDYYSVFENTETHNTLDQDTATAKVDYRLDDFWTLTSVTSGTWSEYHSIIDFDRTTVGNRSTPRHHEQTLGSQELRLGYASERVNGVIGAYLGRFEGKIDDQLVNAGTVLLDQQGKTEINSQALFGELNWEFVDGWQLITGLRWDHEKNHTKIDYPLNPASSADEDLSSSVLLPKIGLSHELTDNQVLGLTWQRGYRSGGVNVRAGAAHRPYDPEFTSTYELAWRGTWLDRRLRTSANLYHTRWKDQQVSFLNLSDNTVQVANAAESRMIGMEFSAEYLVTSQLLVNAGFAYNDTKYEDFVRDGVDLSGREFVFAPKKMANVGVNYTFDSGLMIGGDVVYQGNSISNFNVNGAREVTGERRNDSVTLVNLNAELPIGNLTLSGYVRNLFDEEYITNNQSDDLLDVGAPMTLGVAARYDF
ncbi:TonB-dependent receptor [Ectopseudomonas toyotomiensis]|uniref:TonB-dependent receptor n=1 Tax=Ectopseudomonas toyotomiensis TaxID=554344 RepID=A0AA42IJQ1_9GAMM|nr:TonB-dependent receptor [Pseudomonas toyotomiensis]MBG0842132.1 TonB-dependent receptor [Pseudomonas toyotomiensis]MDH0701082.1 TonB-dependent receptor [Pseudomonas toyotomiensis]